MKFVEFSIKNSLFVNLITIFVCVAGIAAMLNLRKDAFPEVSFDQVTVQAIYSGAPAEDVEKFVTIPLEKEIKSVGGIKEITSTSDEGVSFIGITINPEEKDKEKVVRDIQRSVDRVENLPDEVEDPLVTEITTKEFPILEISLSGQLAEAGLREWAESLEDQILDVKGVASVSRVGWRDREYWVELDPDKLSKYYVSFDEVLQALKSRNITIPAGQVVTADTEFNVRSFGEFNSPQEVEEVVIRANDAGNWVKVKDVGRVIDTFADETRIAKVNGKHALAMVVLKQEAADAISLTDNVKRVIEKFKEALPQGLEITITNDFSYYIKRRLNVLKSNGIQGFIFVLLILFLFMEPIPAITTALGIPFALFATFIVMYVLGLSINLITMLGLIIVLGMLVDDGIVASENIYRYIEKGMDPKEAAVKGADEVVSPILGSIITTWAAFFPLLFMKDIIGKFIHSIPIVVIVALAASLVEAFFVLPTHLAEWSKPHKKDAQGKIVHHQEKKWLKKLLGAYQGALKKAILFRYPLLGASVVLFAVTIWIAFSHMKVILFTGEGVERFYIRAEAKKGTPLEKMDELLNPVEEMVAGLSKENVDSFRTYIGSIETEARYDPTGKRGTHLAQVTVFLTPLQNRKDTPKEIMDSIRPQLEKIQGFEKLYFFQPKEGPPVGRPVAVAIRGDDYTVLERIAQEFKDALQELPGVSDVDVSYAYGKKQLKVKIDEEKAQQYYLTVGQVATTVKNAIKGGVATTIKPSKAEKEIDVLVRFPKEERANIGIFEKIFVRNNFGKLIPLTAVAAIEEIEGVYQINHLDGKRVVMVTAEVDNKKATSFSVNQELKRRFKNTPEQYRNYHIKFSGEFEEQQQSLRNLVVSFLLVLFFIFIILAQEFKSIIQPLLIMLTIPFGIIGVILAFLLHGRPLSFFALLGLVGLAGVVVNSAIVLIDFINLRRREGADLHTAVLEAASTRLRPILMTSTTTVAGLVSVAYGIGGGDPFLKPMALAIMWGLSFATLLTLFLIPCLYIIMEDLSQKFFHRASIKLQEE